MDPYAACATNSGSAGAGRAAGECGGGGGSKTTNDFNTILATIPFFINDTLAGVNFSVLGLPLPLTRCVRYYGVTAVTNANCAQDNAR